MFPFCCQTFLQFLEQHFRILQYLTSRLPESALQKWQSVVTGLQNEMTRLQQHGLEKGTRMQETLQVERVQCTLSICSHSHNMCII